MKNKFYKKLYTLIVIVIITLVLIISKRPFKTAKKTTPTQKYISEKYGFSFHYNPSDFKNIRRYSYPSGLEGILMDIEKIGETTPPIATINIQVDPLDKRSEKTIPIKVCDNEIYQVSNTTWDWFDQHQQGKTQTVYIPHKTNTIIAEVFIGAEIKDTSKEIELRKIFENIVCKVEFH